MYISYEWYRIFYMVAKYKSITAAANAMDLTQPTVTHYIQRLEESLESILFTRGKKGVSLTPEGEVIYQFIEKACENVMRAEKELELYKKNESGELIIGANETTLHHFLLPYISDYRKMYPGIKLVIKNNVAPVIMEQVKKGVIDCGIIFSNEDYSGKDLFVKRLTELPHILVAGKEVAGLAHGEVPLKEIENYPFIGLDENTMAGRLHRRFFQEHDTQYQPDIVMATADLIVPVIAKNLGIGLVPEPFAAEALKQGTIYKVQIKEKLPSLGICFVCEKNRLQKESVKRMYEWIVSNEFTNEFHKY